jgi:hypothetical protein
MDKRTSKALDKSIRKWTRIVRGEGVDKGVENCALCKLFWLPTSGTICAGCPVFLKTGSPYCDDSPYVEWENYFQPGDRPFRVTDDKSLELAKAVLEFLKSLRE